MRRAPPRLVAFGVAVGLATPRHQTATPRATRTRPLLRPAVLCRSRDGGLSLPALCEAQGCSVAPGPVSGRGNAESMCCDSAADCCGGICLRGDLRGLPVRRSRRRRQLTPGLHRRHLSGRAGRNGGCRLLPDGLAGAADPPDTVLALRASAARPGAGDVCGWDCCPANTPKRRERALLASAATDTVCGKSEECRPPPGGLFGRHLLQPAQNAVRRQLLRPSSGRNLHAQAESLLRWQLRRRLRQGHYLRQRLSRRRLRDLRERKLLSEQSGVRPRAPPARAALFRRVVCFRGVPGWPEPLSIRTRVSRALLSPGHVLHGRSVCCPPATYVSDTPPTCQQLK